MKKRYDYELTYCYMVKYLRRKRKNLALLYNIASCRQLHRRFKLSVDGCDSLAEHRLIMVPPCIRAILLAIKDSPSCPSYTVWTKMVDRFIKLRKQVIIAQVFRKIQGIR